MKNILFILILLIYQNSISQGALSSNTTFPIDYFESPLDIPLILSGTFGELRTNHFHSGLDIKTLGKEGLNVTTAAEGYVSRIKVSAWGYGKALYITHPNGYTSVYAHLKKFNNKIEAFVKKHQYSKKSFEIQLFPQASALPISKGEVIALSGNSGSSGGPHLHFEIRNSKTEKPINPMLFGIQINDAIKPRINTLIGYSLSDESHINRISKPSQISLIKLKDGNLTTPIINAYGKIGFGINAYDQLDGAYNKNGLYSLTMLVNGTKVHEFNATSFSFSESKYINLLIDYERLANLNQRIQKCFIEPSNKLSLYKKSDTKGYLTVKDGLNYNVEVIAKDFKGNTQSIKIPIVGKKDSLIVANNLKETPYKINFKEFNKFSLNGVSIAFPKNTFYNNEFLDFKVENNIVKVHTPTIPLDKNYTLTFDVSKYSPEEKKHLYIASVNKYGTTSYQKTIKKNTTFYTSTKKLGNYTLASDNEKPIIKLLNIRNEQWLTKYNSIKVHISDSGSGIKSYKGEIDGEWILMEYDAKTDKLTYDLNDKSFTNAKHNLKVTVTDNVGNTRVLNATFYRKK
ncbi:M23 family metallopeptidase [uncultured Lutibacter sp.]|uniref:M23 family metallopeptidase n=1 Tax=uncultured Lutibacter sp. TaxID=437739 RepID=UPI002624FDE5|nr:M23 family metallopeptidase [uncultured Lutibacter sp.]